MNMIYLDNAATTRPLGERSANPFGEGHIVNGCKTPIWFNSHSSYSNGDNILWKCREIIGEYIECKPNEVVFTSGGCEGNSLLISTLYNRLDRVVLVSKREHKSVIRNKKVLSIGDVNDVDWLIGVGNEYL